MEPYERRRFHVENKAYFHKSMRIARYDSLTSPVMEWMGIFTITLTLMAGLYLAVNQKTHLLGIQLSDRPPSIASLLVFYGLLAGTSDPVRKLSGIFSRIQRAAAAADRVYALIDREPTIVDPPQPVTLKRHRSSLEFREIRFAYRAGVPVLEGVQLEIPFGQSVALVGPNGCGKSTLANLVPRFQDPQSGAILIDGHDVRSLRLRELRRQIGIVTQEPVLFNESVANNIRYGNPSATDFEVQAAARKAHADRFIEEKLPHGYDTLIGERGGTLSGGQRQRLALARAILRDPAILILDEATSQIDVESERLIHMALEEFMRNRTTLMITHRQSTLALVDRIVVLEQGRIVDEGTHGDLVRRCTFYQRLFREAA
jgi:ATP-binding cassette subfamily B protein/subfamily B ATP-binding cassette protein MsbA